MRELSVPISRRDILSLHAGDMISLSGAVVTARDTAHEYMVKTLLSGVMPESERAVYERLRCTLSSGVLYHCGPVVEHTQSGWRFVAAGPTTSAREEMYEAQVIKHFGIRAIIGKGGMGPSTLAACVDAGAVYLHAIGGTAALVARRVLEVLDVFKLEFGSPEALWVIRVEGLELMVTMDAHGRSWHDEVNVSSATRLAQLLKTC